MRNNLLGINFRYLSQEISGQFHQNAILFRQKNSDQQSMSSTFYARVFHMKFWPKNYKVEI